MDRKRSATRQDQKLCNRRVFGPPFRSCLDRNEGSRSTRALMLFESNAQLRRTLPSESSGLSQRGGDGVEQFVHGKPAWHHAGAGDVIDRGFQIAPVRVQPEWRVLRIAGSAREAL